MSVLAELKFSAKSMGSAEAVSRAAGAWAVAWCLLGVAHAEVDAFNDEIGPATVIYQEKSIYRNILVVDAARHRCMSFGRHHVYQTCIAFEDRNHLAFGYAKALLAALYLVPQPQRVLVIGLGGGVMPMALRRLDPGMEIDTVELDPAVIAVAKTYFGFIEDAKSRTHVGDGRTFVRQQLRAARPYDMILIDAFDKDHTPEHLTTLEFLTQVKTLLRPGGAVAINSFGGHALEQHLAATCVAAFGNTLTVTMDTNRIVIAGRDGLPDLKDVQRNAMALDPILVQFLTSSATLLPLMSLQTPVSVADARPLTDKFSPANLLLK